VIVLSPLTTSIGRRHHASTILEVALRSHIPSFTFAWSAFHLKISGGDLMFARLAGRTGLRWRSGVEALNDPKSQGGGATPPPDRRSAIGGRSASSTAPFSSSWLGFCSKRMSGADFRFLAHDPFAVIRPRPMLRPARQPGIRDARFLTAWRQGRGRWSGRVADVQSVRMANDAPCPRRSRASFFVAPRLGGGIPKPGARPSEEKSERRPPPGLTLRR
jgi:hypothetical protein